MIDVMNVHQFATQHFGEMKEMGEKIVHAVKPLQPHKYNADGSRRTAQQSKIDEIHEHLFGGGEQQQPAVNPNPMDFTSSWEDHPDYDPAIKPGQSNVGNMLDAARRLSAKYDQSQV